MMSGIKVQDQYIVNVSSTILSSYCVVITLAYAYRSLSVYEERHPESNERHCTKKGHFANLD